MKKENTEQKVNYFVDMLQIFTLSYVCKSIVYAFCIIIQYDS